MNYRQTLNYIHSLGNFSKPASLERITRLLEKLGNPQNRFSTVHVAGTNGKGSVSIMLSEVFRRNGKKTGLFISPFIIDFRERIQIDGNFIGTDDMVKYSEMVISQNVEVTEFEFITAVAFLYFYEKGCEAVVVETGLGGRLDATNTISRPNAVVITKIGMDHTAILGDDIEQITNEKCSIIRDCPVIISCNQINSVYSIIKDRTDRLIIPDKAELEIINSDNGGNRFVYKNKNYETSLCGEYQIENALTVIETASNCGFEIPYETVFSAIKNTFFPARMEIISKKPLVVLDGAHNSDGAEALSAFMSKYSGRITAIIGVMKDKNYREILEKTLIHCKSAVAVTVEGMPRALSAVNLCRAGREWCNCVTAKNYGSAIKKAVELSNEEPIFVYGSLYLASGIREKLIKYYKNLN